MRSNSVGFQLPGGPFVQVGYVESQVWLTFSAVHDDGTTVSSGELRFQGDPEVLLSGMDCWPELQGAIRDMCERALDFKAQLQEVTR